MTGDRGLESIAAPLFWILWALEYSPGVNNTTGLAANSVSGTLGGCISLPPNPGPYRAPIGVLG